MLDLFTLFSYYMSKKEALYFNFYLFIGKLSFNESLLFLNLRLFFINSESLKTGTIL